MVALAPIQNSRQTFECLRCGHQETLRMDMTSKPMPVSGWRVRPPTQLL
jgi:hypothetical protein